MVDVESTIFPFMGYLFEFSFSQNFLPSYVAYLAHMLLI